METEVLTGHGGEAILEPPRLIHLGKVREVIKGSGSAEFDSFTASPSCVSPGEDPEPDVLFCP